MKNKLLKISILILGITLFCGQAVAASRIDRCFDFLNREMGLDRHAPNCNLQCRQARVRYMEETGRNGMHPNVACLIGSCSWFCTCNGVKLETYKESWDKQPEKWLTEDDMVFFKDMLTVVKKWLSHSVPRTTNAGPYVSLASAANSMSDATNDGDYIYLYTGLLDYVNPQLGRGIVEMYNSNVRAFQGLDIYQENEASRQHNLARAERDSGCSPYGLEDYDPSNQVEGAP